MTDAQPPANGGPPEFEGRKPEVRSAVVRFRDGEREFVAGQALLGQNEPCTGLFHLSEGWLVYSREGQSGRPADILQFGLPGAVLGCRNEAVAFSVQALTAATVSAIPAPNLVALSLEHPGLGDRLRGLATRPHRFAFQHMPNAMTQSVRERVAQLLLELFIRARTQWPDHTAEHMRLPLSADHVVGATHIVSAPEILRELQQKNIVRFDERGIAISDPDALIDTTGVDLPAMRAFLLG